MATIEPLRGEILEWKEQKGSGLVALLLGCALAFAGGALTLTCVGAIFGVPMMFMAGGLIAEGGPGYRMRVACPRCRNSLWAFRGKQAASAAVKCPHCKARVIVDHEGAKVYPQ
jgi:ribosomal protein S27E